MAIFKEMEETHCKGTLEIHDDWKRFTDDITDCDLGLQVSYDGRVWLCINGIVFVRFKPNMEEKDGM